MDRPLRKSTFGRSKSSRRTRSSVPLPRRSTRARGVSAGNLGRAGGAQQEFRRRRDYMYLRSVIWDFEFQ